MTHREIFELLPWYANATLAEAERRELEQHLSVCAECARELEALRTIQAAAIQLAESAPHPAPDMLGKALAEIERWERRRPRHWFAQAAAWFGAWWVPSPAFARAVMVAQLALIVALAGFLLVQRQPGTGYTTLTGPRVPPDAVHFIAGFRPEATEAAIQEVLAEVNGQFVSGPSALGLYTIRVPVSSDPDAATRLLERLRQKSEVIRFAEIAR